LQFFDEVTLNNDNIDFTLLDVKKEWYIKEKITSYKDIPLENE